MPTDRPFDLARIVFQLLALTVLIASSFWILRPFLVPLTWAVTIVVATWPLLTRAQAWLGGRRGLAAAAMTVVLLLAFAVPLAFMVMTVVATARHLADLREWVAAITVPAPPGWVETLPSVAERWRRAASASREETAAFLSPYARGLALALVSQVGSVGRLLVDLLLTVVIAGILYATGETAARGAMRFAGRLSGGYGENAVRLAGQAIRAVALGVVVTALVLSAMCGIGLAVAGVPFAAILTVVIFILSVAQVGPIPVLIAAVIWVYATHGAAWGTGLLVWALVCTTVDHVLRPLLIKRGADDLPLLLIFAGVVGGIVAFGVIGLFIGPVVLAVAYTLVAAWVSQEHEGDWPASAPTTARRRE